MPTRPTTPEVRLERLTAESVASGDFDKAILPLGATEYHGAHLPYGTDTFGAEVLAEAIARELGGMLVLPTLDYGASSHHLDWSWTVSLRPETMSRVIQDIGASLVQHNIRKLALLTAHDGNPHVAFVAARSLFQDHGIEIAIIGGWQTTARELLRGQHDIDGDHGGQSEMSLVLYAEPETARLDLAVNQPNQRFGQAAYLVGNYKGTVPQGYSGKAADGTVEEGEAIVRAMTDHIVPYLRELDANGWKRGGWLSGIYE
jgi:creatinine amidohydrolase